MNDSQFAILKTKLAGEFVPPLPPLLDRSKPAEHQVTKNISRAFSAFVIHKMCGLNADLSAKSVVDDYEDNGIDAIHFHQTSKKLFIVQGKIKATENFEQGEAFVFIKGVKDLVNEHYDRFNQHVRNRQIELEHALDQAEEIILVIAHCGGVVSQHAKDALNQFLTDCDRPDERLSNGWIDFDAQQVVEELLAEHKVKDVDDDLIIIGPQKIDEPRLSYYGQVSVKSLADLYTTYGTRLLEKNIRYFIGMGSSTVNQAICDTLEQTPAEFGYLNNGVTAIARSIEQRGVKLGGRRYEVKSLSIINGAQTIASCHHFVNTRPDVDISAATVFFTIIQVDNDEEFGLRITKARNHQNPVSLASFAALHHVQERLRRELAFHRIAYRYRPESHPPSQGLDIMDIDEAAVALALFHPNPSFPVTIKRGHSRLLNTESKEYTQLFESQLSGAKLANAVRLYRSATKTLVNSELSSGGLDKLIYRHGRFAIMWMTFRNNYDWLNRNDVMTAANADTLLSQPLDLWRERVRTRATVDLAAVDKGPLAFFRNLTDITPFMVKLLTEYPRTNA